MTVKVAINGFGRIGRLVFRAGRENPKFRFVAVNDLTDAATLAHLLKYDSVHRELPGPVEAGEGVIRIKNGEIRVFGEKDPASLPWKELGVDIVIEATGRFRKREEAALHLKAGAKKVILTAPGKNMDATINIGINQDKYDPAKHSVISNASCTTNSLTPVVKPLLDRFGIEKALVTTIHSYTSDQNLLDAPHKDLRRARAAAVSMVPTTTGAAKAVALVIPVLEGRFDGVAIRVPTPNVSLSDISLLLGRSTTVAEVNSTLQEAAEGKLKGILGYSVLPLVSSDFIGSAFSAVVDADLTRVVGGNLVKVFSWYDNEWGYSCRIVDSIELMVDKGL